MGVTDINRIAGPNRYDTAVAMANYGTSRGWFAAKTDALVSASLPDALSGGAMGVGPMLYCSRDALATSTKNWLKAQKAAGHMLECYVLGGTASISNNRALAALYASYEP